MSILDRIKRLEAILLRSSEPEKPLLPELQDYLLSVEDYQCEQQGLEPRPRTEEELGWERLEEEDFLAGMLPMYRESTGLQHDESRSLLDEWEEDSEMRLQELQEHLEGEGGG